jgi:glutathione S-transferase
MHTLFDSRFSGNAWKVRLVLERLGLPYRRVTLDLASGQSRTPEFLARNPTGKIPVLELPDGTNLAESGAILLHLAEGTDLLPAERIIRAQTWRWMFWEQAEMVKPLGLARFWIGLRNQRVEKAAEIPGWHEAGGQCLGQLDGALAARAFLCGHAVTIADYAVYPYVSLSPQGDFNLDGFPSVRAWLRRMEAQPRHVSLLQD